VSRPAWARELKHIDYPALAIYIRSRPAWARELKLAVQNEPHELVRSRPAWARELKLEPDACPWFHECRAPRGRVN